MIQRNITDYTRVTEVLYPFTGLSKIDPEVLENAASRGTIVHKLCDCLAFRIGIFPGDIDELVKTYTIKSDRSSDENEIHFQKEKKLVENFIKSFEKWYIDKDFIDKPARFYEDKLMITGECDLIYKDEKGHLILVDLKTPSSESKSWLLQGSAYSYMAKKIGYDIQAIEFLQISRIGSKPKIFKYEENFDLFRSHLNAYRYSFKDCFIENNLDYL